MTITNIFFILLLGLSSTPVFADAEEDLALEKRLSAEYLTQMTAEPNAQVLEEGVVLRPIFVSESQVYPLLTDYVRVNYHLTDRLGDILEDSLVSDELAVFPLGRLITCWKIALPKISVGSLYKLSCPSDTAYGDHGAGDGLIKPGAALTFRVTLYGIGQ